MNASLVAALLEHSRWYTRRIGTVQPEWYVFPGRTGRPVEGKKRPLDTLKPTTSLKTAWRNVKARAGVVGRWHDTRHTLITELAEGAATDQTIMAIAGHVSPQMLKKYSHIRMEAKRAALKTVGTNRNPSSPKAAEEADTNLSTTNDSQSSGAQNWAQQ